MQGEPIRLIRKFIITQSRGKCRIIDDAASGGQSVASTDENVLCFCNALQPAYNLSALKAALLRRGFPWPSDGHISSAGEDWPHAYRYTPMHPEESRACIVVWWHPGRRCPVFQQYTGMLFGLPNAVTSFNRWSRLAQALIRRLLAPLRTLFDVLR